MILAKGRLYESKDQDIILKGLKTEINTTLMTESLSVETVIDAIDGLSKKLENGEFDEIIDAFLPEESRRYKQMAIRLLNRESIEHKVRCELGEDFFTAHQTTPPKGQKSITVKAMPLGAILHVAAGNVDGLPAFSLAEGLLTGNVNILKLPQADNGLSLQIIQALIEAEPALGNFIYVFDTPSTDLAAIKKLADAVDAIVVWGGDGAVCAVRRFAPAGTRLIEWGHKLGFAYISGYEDKEGELTALAKHIVTTKQLLCSSCQTIFLDTQSLDQVYEFCRYFLPLLEAETKKHPPESMGVMAEITLLKYNGVLNKILEGSDQERPGFFQGEGCSLTACEDHELMLSPMFGGCLVKRLPRKDLITLREKKGYLQTAGLICTPGKRASLTQELAKCGVVRITRAGSMSELFSGEAHDGEYPLRRYVRMVNVE